MRVGKIVQPETAVLFDTDSKELMNQNWIQKGTKWLLDKFLPNQGGPKITTFIRVDNNYEIKPNELIIFQTKEKINLPMNVSAYYSTLDSIAKQGLLLINSSVVEPGYEGYLSGVLLNFSSRSYMLKPDMEIVKINFFQVGGDVDNKLTESLGDAYTEKLQETALHYTRTFLDVERIKEDVLRQTSEKVSRNLKFGGWLLALLLAFCTIEPVIYKYLWHDSWVPMNSTYIEMERSMRSQKQMELLDSLSKEIDNLKIKLEKKDAKEPNFKPQRRI
jgi:deoxycytidine triphosphate deaminase